MATQFIGLHMRVVLQQPAGYQLTGIVRDVEAGNSLTLTQVTIPGRHGEVPHMTIDARNIADLSEVPMVKHQQQHQQAGSHASPTASAPNRPEPSSQPAAQGGFVDPAILSLGRRPTSRTPTSSVRSVRVSSNGDHGSQTHQPVLNIPGFPPLLAKKASGEAITSPMRTLKVEDPAQDTPEAQAAGADGTSKDKKKKPRTRQSRKSKGNVEDGIVQADGASPLNVAETHGKGWRETPILQDTTSFQPFKALKRNGRGRIGGVDNGWASEDVTEELPEFDFENNLAKFDKRTIFDQMRKDDEVDDASRLVSHNRRPKPGTAGGKNLHYTENVLDVPSNAAQNADFWNSEADVAANDGERLSGRETRSGQTMRRTESKPGATRRSQSRKASGPIGPVLGSQPLSRVNSNTHLPAHPRQPGLYLHHSDRRLETISTLQMLNLENISANELGFTEDLMAENAGRGIAEVALTALAEPAMKARYELAMASSPRQTPVDPSTVVILGGSNKSSIRALAAGRHLRNRGINVIVCLVGIEREKEMLEDLRRQIQLYRNFGGKVLSKNDFFEHLRRSSASGGQAWVSLIIDALLGLTMSFEELRIGDQASVYELMEWANRNEAFVLSVDIPSGIDPTSGKIAIIDGSPLFVKPRYVVSIGAPKRGLLEALTPVPDDEISGGPAQEDQWRLFVADLGFGSAVWRKAGTKARKGIDFDGKWVLEMKYQGVTEEDYDD